MNRMKTQRGRRGYFATILVLIVSALPLQVNADADGGCPGFGWGMGSGMMQGFGMGPGMMGQGGWGMGPGMMGGRGLGWFGALNLSNEQRDKIKTIQDEQRKAQWETMGKIMDEQEQLSEIYEADNPDTKKIGAVYGRIAKLHQQMAEAGVNAWNRIQALLTKEQKEQLKQLRRGGWGPGGGGYGSGNMPGSGMMRR